MPAEAVACVDALGERVRAAGHHPVLGVVIEIEGGLQAPSAGGCDQRHAVVQVAAVDVDLFARAAPVGVCGPDAVLIRSRGAGRRRDHQVGCGTRIPMVVDRRNLVRVGSARLDRAVGERRVRAPEAIAAHAAGVVVQDTRAIRVIHRALPLHVHHAWRNPGRKGLGVNRGRRYRVVGAKFHHRDGVRRRHGAASDAGHPRAKGAAEVDSVRGAVNRDLCTTARSKRRTNLHTVMAGHRSAPDLRDHAVDGLIGCQCGRTSACRRIERWVLQLHGKVASGAGQGVGGGTQILHVITAARLQRQGRPPWRSGSRRRLRWRSDPTTPAPPVFRSGSNWRR